MSEQATMTREQLEAAGYVFDGSQNVESPDGWSWSSWRDDYVLEAATAHYRQQQELAALRRGIMSIQKQVAAMVVARSPIYKPSKRLEALVDYVNALVQETTVSESEHTD